MEEDAATPHSHLPYIVSATWAAGVYPGGLGQADRAHVLCPLSISAWGVRSRCNLPVSGTHSTDRVKLRCPLLTLQLWRCNEAFPKRSEGAIHLPEIYLVQPKTFAAPSSTVRLPSVIISIHCGANGGHCVSDSHIIPLALPSSTTFAFCKRYFGTFNLHLHLVECLVLRAEFSGHFSPLIIHLGSKDSD